MDSALLGYQNQKINNLSQLVLGTAQLGMNYGIANKTGKPDIQMAQNIIGTAWEGGIRVFDTAQTYGDSEEILGKVFSDLGISREVRVITKPDPLINHTNKKDMKNAVSKSLEKLKLDRLYGLMLHREDSLYLFDKGLNDILLYFIDEGFVEHVGISLYSPSRVNTVLETDVISMVQIPANICDHRFCSAGVCDLGKTRGKEIYIRSVFLQGLILTAESKIPEKMQFTSSVIEKVTYLCREFGMTRQELALSYIKQKYSGAFIVLGAETQRQLADNLNVWALDTVESITAKVDEVFADVDEKIINPILWPN